VNKSSLGFDFSFLNFHFLTILLTLFKVRTEGKQWSQQ